jgi:putative acetyltransferase
MNRKVTVQVTNPALPAARHLIEELDAYLGSLYPPECNHLLPVKALQKPNVIFLTACLDGKMVGCGAYVNHREYAEIKRMYVVPECRGMKIGKRILQELEKRIISGGLKIARLETGVHQPEALVLYAGMGYQKRKAFGSYRNDEYMSVFMEKKLG